MDMINSITCPEEINAPVAKAMSSSTPLPEDNVGSKLMRSMGWAGGGLGKAEQGIQEPVSVSFKLNRAGLGNNNRNQALKKFKFDVNERKFFKSKAQAYLTQYKIKDLILNLHFPHSEFSIWELNTIHQLANSLGLQCSANRTHDDRRLVISKQETLELIVARMLHLDVYSDEYSELQEPLNRKLLDNFEPETLMASDFPQLCHKINDSPSSLNRDSVNEMLYERRLIDTFFKGKRQEEKQDQKFTKTKTSTTYFKKKKSKNLYRLEAISIGPYGTFFLIEHPDSYDSPWSIMNFSAVQNNIPIKIERCRVDNSWSCKLFVNGHLLVSCSGDSESDVRDKAINEAYTKLKQICYVLKVKSNFMLEDTVVEKTDNFKNVTSVSNSNNSLDKILGEKFDGKLMQAMESTGDGLGNEKQGIEEPVCVAQRVYRSSIISDPIPNISKKKKSKQTKSTFRKSVRPILEKYARDDSSHGIMFSSDFSQPERAILHRMANQLSLKSKSYGNANDRFLVISKMINYCKVVEEMLRTGEYSSPSYELIKPPVSCNANCEDLSAADSISSDKETKVSSVSQPTKEESLKVGEVKNEDSSVVNSSDLNVVKLHEKDVNKLPPQQQIGNDKNAQPYGPLILLENDKSLLPLLILEKSANASHVPFRMEYCKIKGGVYCRIYVNNILVASNFDTSKKKARDLSVSYGLKALQEVCYSLKSEMNVVGDCLKTITTIKKPNNLKSGDSSPVSEIVCNSKQLDWFSLGLKNRENVSEAEFISGIHDFLHEYILENYPYDLVVSQDFSGQELAKIQKIAVSLGLKISYPRIDHKDFLIIYKKHSILQITQAFLKKEENASSSSLDKANDDVICSE